MVNGPAVATSTTKQVAQLLRSKVVVGLWVSSALRLLGSCSEAAHVSDKKNRIPEARLGGLFVRNMYKKDGILYSRRCNSFPLYSCLFYLGEIITSGMEFKGGEKEGRLV
jgi:hypothetical protein